MTSKALATAGAFLFQKKIDNLTLRVIMFQNETLFDKSYLTQGGIYGRFR